MIKKLIEWNVSANVALLDARFVRTLMCICIGLKNLKLLDFHENTMEFIRDLFRIRCDKYEERYAQFKNIVDTYIRELQEK